MTPCLYCVEKHLGMACGYLSEARAGYPGRLGMAIGQMALAEEEAPEDLRSSIRTERKLLEQGRLGAQPDFERLLGEVQQRISKRPTLRRQSTPEPCCGKKRVATTEGRTLVLVTTFASFDDAYSLCQVVIDQALAAALEGMQVHIWVLDCFYQPSTPAVLADEPKVTIEPCIPTWVWKDDEIDESKALEVSERLVALLHELPADAVVISHDLLLQAAFITYAHAWHLVARRLPGRCVWHVAHSSVPAEPILQGDARWRSLLPPGHRILALNGLQTGILASYYQTVHDQVDVLFNARDATQHMTPWARRFAYRVGLLEASISQVYPFSATRTDAKGVPHLIRAFGTLRNRGERVCLVLCDAHATDPVAVASKERCQQIVAEVGLQGMVHWVSDDLGMEAYAGLPHAQVMELMRLSNLFLFPSISECAPLVLLEAAVSGCLCVPNLDVPAMEDILDHSMGLFWSFGTRADVEVDYDSLAEAVVTRLRGDVRNRAQRTVFLERSLPALGRGLARLGIAPLVQGDTINPEGNHG